MDSSETADDMETTDRKLLSTDFGQKIDKETLKCLSAAIQPSAVEKPVVGVGSIKNKMQEINQLIAKSLEERQNVLQSRDYIRKQLDLIKNDKTDDIDSQIQMPTRKKHRRRRPQSNNTENVIGISNKESNIEGIDLISSIGNLGPLPPTSEVDLVSSKDINHLIQENIIPVENMDKEESVVNVNSDKLIKNAEVININENLKQDCNEEIKFSEGIQQQYQNDKSEIENDIYQMLPNNAIETPIGTLKRSEDNSKKLEEESDIKEEDYEYTYSYDEDENANSPCLTESKVFQKRSKSRHRRKPKNGECVTMTPKASAFLEARRKKRLNAVLLQAPFFTSNEVIETPKIDKSIEIFVSDSSPSAKIKNSNSINGFRKPNAAMLSSVDINAIAEGGEMQKNGIVTDSEGNRLTSMKTSLDEFLAIYDTIANNDDLKNKVKEVVKDIRNEEAIERRKKYLHDPVNLKSDIIFMENIKKMKPPITSTKFNIDEKIKQAMSHYAEEIIKRFKKEGKTLEDMGKNNSDKEILNKIKFYQNPPDSATIDLNEKLFFEAIYCNMIYENEKKEREEKEAKDSKIRSVPNINKKSRMIVGERDGNVYENLYNTRIKPYDDDDKRIKLLEKYEKDCIADTKTAIPTVVNGKKVTKELFGELVKEFEEKKNMENEEIKQYKKIISECTFKPQLNFTGVDKQNFNKNDDKLINAYVNILVEKMINDEMEKQLFEQLNTREEESFECNDFENIKEDKYNGENKESFPLELCDKESKDKFKDHEEKNNVCEDDIVESQNIEDEIVKGDTAEKSIEENGKENKITNDVIGPVLTLEELKENSEKSEQKELTQKLYIEAKRKAKKDISAGFEQRLLIETYLDLEKKKKRVQEYEDKFKKECTYNPKLRVTPKTKKMVESLRTKLDNQIHDMFQNSLIDLVNSARINEQTDFEDNCNSQKPLSIGFEWNCNNFTDGMSNDIKNKLENPIYADTGERLYNYSKVIREKHKTKYEGKIEHQIDYSNSPATNMGTKLLREHRRRKMHDAVVNQTINKNVTAVEQKLLQTNQQELKIEDLAEAIEYYYEDQISNEHEDDYVLLQKAKDNIFDMPEKIQTESELEEEYYAPEIEQIDQFEDVMQKYVEMRANELSDTDYSILDHRNTNTIKKYDKKIIPKSNPNIELPALDQNHKDTLRHTTISEVARTSVERHKLLYNKGMIAKAKKVLAAMLEEKRERLIAAQPKINKKSLITVEANKDKYENNYLRETAAHLFSASKPTIIENEKAIDERLIKTLTKMNELKTDYYKECTFTPNIEVSQASQYGIVQNSNVPSYLKLYNKAKRNYNNELKQSFFDQEIANTTEKRKNLKAVKPMDRLTYERLCSGNNGCMLTINQEDDLSDCTFKPTLISSSVKATSKLVKSGLFVPVSNQNSIVQSSNKKEPLNIRTKTNNSNKEIELLEKFYNKVKQAEQEEKQKNFYYDHSSPISIETEMKMSTRTVESIKKRTKAIEQQRINRSIAEQNLVKWGKSWEKVAYVSNIDENYQTDNKNIVKNKNPTKIGTKETIEDVLIDCYQGRKSGNSNKKSKEFNSDDINQLLTAAESSISMSLAYTKHSEEDEKKLNKNDDLEVEDNLAGMSESDAQEYEYVDEYVDEDECDKEFIAQVLGEKLTKEMSIKSAEKRVTNNKPVKVIVQTVPYTKFHLKAQNINFGKIAESIDKEYKMRILWRNGMNQ